MPGICVVVVNWNSGGCLGKCLTALKKQTLPPSRIIVVDNASTDSSLPAPMAGVEIARLGTNAGFAAATNFGASLAWDCDWIALLNPDAFPEPDWLEALMRAAQVSPDHTCFASRMIQAGQPAVLDGAGDAYHTSGRVWRRGHAGPAEGRYREREEVFSACAAAALYRRDALGAVGGFDDDFFCYLEDVDLGFRLRLAGYRCLYVPDAVVHHVGSAATGKNSDFAVYHGHRNLVWTYVKNMPAPLFWLYLPLHVALNVFTVIAYTLKGRSRVILKSKWDAIRGLPTMWKKRKDIQARCAVGAWEIRSLLAKGFSRSRR